MVLVIVVIETQLTSSQLCTINEEIDNYIRSLRMVERVTGFTQNSKEKSEATDQAGGDPSATAEAATAAPTADSSDEDEGRLHNSNILNYVSLDSIKNMNDVIHFVKYVLPNIGEAKDIVSALNE